MKRCSSGRNAREALKVTTILSALSVPMVQRDESSVPRTVHGGECGAERVYVGVRGQEAAGLDLPEANRVIIRPDFFLTNNCTSAFRKDISWIQFLFNLNQKKMAYLSQNKSFVPMKSSHYIFVSRKVLMPKGFFTNHIPPLLLSLTASYRYRPR